MSQSTLLRSLSAALGAPSYRSQLYTRYCLHRPGLFAQVLLLPGDACRMEVQADKETLDVDFRRESTRPDVPGEPRSRPGYRIADELDMARRQNDRRILFNGNNVGYWGNQFVADQAALVYKARGPIFDDDDMVRHAGGDHTFFCWSERGFSVADHGVDADWADAHSGISLYPADWITFPHTGLSGYPLVRDGIAVWAEHRSGAWDPNLLYDVGRLTGVGRADVERDIVERTRAGEQLMRHPLTAVGVDRAGNAVVLVAEKSGRSAGISVAEAAQMLCDLGATDAVALGAAGDAQIATTAEGFLTAPLVAPHVRHAALPLGRRHKSPYLADMVVAARPVPCLVSIGHRGVTEPTEALPIIGDTGRHSSGVSAAAR